MSAVRRQVSAAVYRFGFCCNRDKIVRYAIVRREEKRDVAEVLAEQASRENRCGPNCVRSVDLGLCTGDLRVRPSKYGLPTAPAEPHTAELA